MSFLPTFYPSRDSRIAKQKLSGFFVVERKILYIITINNDKKLIKIRVILHLHRYCISGLILTC
jgi:hypothetical protein